MIKAPSAKLAGLSVISAIILTALRAGLRSRNCVRSILLIIRTTDDGAAVSHVTGKGGKGRSIPIEADLLEVIETYLNGRAVRFPGAETHW